MKETLSQIADRFLSIFDREEEIPLECLADTIDAVEGEIEVKAVNVALWIRNLRMDAEYLKDEETRLAKRRKALETEEAFLCDYLKGNMIRCGVKSAKSPLITVTVSAGGTKVEIDDMNLIQPAYIRRKEVVSADKDMIKEALEGGDEVAGAHLEEVVKLTIR